MACLLCVQPTAVALHCVRVGGLVWPGDLYTGLPLRGGGGKKTGFVTPTETNLQDHRSTIEQWQLVAVGGGWWAVGGWRRLAVVGGWRLAVGGWRLVVPPGCH